MPIPFDFDFKNPDYISVFAWRQQKLLELRRRPELLSALKLYYKGHPAQFIIDWGVTIDPRNPEIGLPAMVPFLLVPKQEEWCGWLMDRWKSRECGLVEKSRDMGLSWLAAALSVTLCLFHDGVYIGYGSRKEEYVDRIGAPKSFFHRVREFISNLPTDFVGGWDARKHAPFMRAVFPETGSYISGESGDNLGRGDRASIYFLDEAAYIERPELAEAALSQTTNCRIDISTPCGSNNPFARKRFSGKVPVFSFHWRDNPFKDQKWYDSKCAQIDDPVLIAQELDLDYSGSVECVLIPAEWVQVAIDAHVKLGFEPSGVRCAGLDVSDEGKDKNAIAGRHGVLLEHIESWSGKSSDIYKTVERALLISDVNGYSQIYYDADGLGAGVRGDARVLNSLRDKKVTFEPFRGSGEVVDPTRCALTGERVSSREHARANADFFANAKAQAWWRLRRRFQLTHRAVKEGVSVGRDDLISLSSKLLELSALCVELSQPTYSQNTAGKIIIDKAPKSARSPNRADAVMIAYAPRPRVSRGFFDVAVQT